MARECGRRRGQHSEQYIEFNACVEPRWQQLQCHNSKLLSNSRRAICNISTRRMPKAKKKTAAGQACGITNQTGRKAVISQRRACVAAATDIQNDSTDETSAPLTRGDIPHLIKQIVTAMAPRTTGNDSTGMRLPAVGDSSGVPTSTSRVDHLENLATPLTRQDIPVLMQQVACYMDSTSLIANNTPPG